MEELFDDDQCGASDEVIPAARVRSLSAADALAVHLDDAETVQLVTNRSAARQAFAIRDAFRVARANPRIYVPVGSTERVPGVDDVDFAERSVAFDLAQRLRLSEHAVREQAHQADVLDASLPRVKGLFVDGMIGLQHVRAAVDNVLGLPDAAAVARYDERLSEIASALPPAAFQRRCRLLRERLCVETLQERHDRQHDLRRVVVEPVDDGMAWIHAYVSTTDAARIDARLAGTATRMRHDAGEHRSVDQLRADALVSWLAGDDTPTAATVQPYLLVDDSGRIAELLGYGPIDPRSAARALRNAPSFRRVVRDPVRPARLTLDRRRYRPSTDQRHWLSVRYGLDDDTAPFVAPAVEIDHVVEYQHGGTTDVANLLPLKPRLHRLKSVTRIRLDPRPDGGIRVRTPTGYDSDRLDGDPPPF